MDREREWEGEQVGSGVGRMEGERTGTSVGAHLWAELETSHS